MANEIQITGSVKAVVFSKRGARVAIDALEKSAREKDADARAMKKSGAVGAEFADARADAMLMRQTARAIESAVFS